MIKNYLEKISLFIAVVFSSWMLILDFGARKSIKNLNVFVMKPHLDTFNLTWLFFGLKHDRSWKHEGNMRSSASLSPFYGALLSFNWRWAEHLSVTFTEEVIKSPFPLKQAASYRQDVLSRLLFWRLRRQSGAERQNKSTRSLFSFPSSRSLLLSFLFDWFWLDDRYQLTSSSMRPWWPRELNRSRIWSRIRAEPKTLLHNLCQRCKK